MPGAVAAWDEAILGAPMWADYVIERELLGQRGAALLAAPFYRRVAGIRSRTVVATVVQDAAQFAAFRTFFSATLDEGQGWFTVGIWQPDGQRTGTGHIESYSPLPVGRGWMYSKTGIVMDWIEA